MYWWGWDQNKYWWRVPLTSARSLAGACCPGFQMIHLVKDKLDDGNYKSCKVLAPCSRSGRPPRGRFWCWTTPPWQMSFKYRINWSKNESEQKPWSMESPEHSSGSVDSGRKSNVNTFGWDKHQGHQELSGESDENNPLKPNQSAPSIYIMIEICYFSLDQWEIRIHLLSGKCFNIPHDCDPHLDQTKFY